MEWLVFVLVVAAVALFIAWPRRADLVPAHSELIDLRGQREALLAELREVEDDALAGRITEDDRREARRLLGVRLRHVTEALRDLGDTPERGRA
jgi:hypothetical protein